MRARRPAQESCPSLRRSSCEVPSTRCQKTPEVSGFAQRPIEGVTFQAGEHQKQQRGIVVRTHPSIDEGARTISSYLNGFRLKIVRSRTAGANHVPQLKVLVRLCVGIVLRRFEVLASGVIVDGPDAAAVQAFGDDDVQS